jgi:hypothetical protein
LNPSHQLKVVKKELKISHSCSILYSRRKTNGVVCLPFFFSIRFGKQKSSAETKALKGVRYSSAFVDDNFRNTAESYKQNGKQEVVVATDN